MSLIQDDEQSGGEVDSHNEEAGVPHTAASVQRLVTGKNYGNNCLSILCCLLLLFDCMRLPCFPVFSFSSFFLSFFLSFILFSPVVFSPYLLSCRLSLEVELCKH